ncbi:MAG: YbaB/EbfC family nucleoid-associated protein [Leptonema sp. (in: bacteria)]
MGIKDKLKQMAELKELKEEASKLQEMMQEIESIDDAGNGAVEATVNGEGKVVRIVLRDNFFAEKDREKQQKWITIAVNGAIEKSKKRVEKEMKKIEKFDKLGKFFK